MSCFSSSQDICPSMTLIDLTAKDNLENQGWVKGKKFALEERTQVWGFELGPVLAPSDLDEWLMKVK